MCCIAKGAIYLSIVHKEESKQSYLNRFFVVFLDVKSLREFTLYRAQRADSSAIYLCVFVLFYVHVKLLL